MIGIYIGSVDGRFDHGFSFADIDCISDGNVFLLFLHRWFVNVSFPNG